MEQSEVVSFTIKLYAWRNKMFVSMMMKIMKNINSQKNAAECCEQREVVEQASDF